MQHEIPELMGNVEAVMLGVFFREVKMKGCGPSQAEKASTSVAILVRP